MRSGRGETAATTTAVAVAVAVAAAAGAVTARGQLPKVADRSSCSRLV